MTRFLLIATLFCFAVPAAFAVPPADKGKPESNEASSQTVEKNAAKACKAERTRIGVQLFNAKYGTNANKKNAYGKCVSMKVKQHEAEDHEEAEANAAKKCKAERESMGLTAFNNKYGTNANKKNAFGKCVSKLAKAQGSSS